MAKVELGLKRTCLSCGMRFYDFKRTPVLCPGCGVEFDPTNFIKGRKTRAAPKAVTASLAAGKTVPNDAANDDLVAGNIVAGNIVAGNIVDDDIDDEEGEANTTAAVDDDDDVLDFDEADTEVDDTDGPGIIQDDLSVDDDLLPKMRNEDDQ